MARDPQSGVSLVEVLVVLTLVGVMAGAMSIRFGDRTGPGYTEHREATRLAVQLTMAAEDAVITGLGSQIAWDATSYRVSDQPVAKLSTPIRTAPASYPITPDLLPALTGPLRLTVGGTVVVFDGARAFLLPEVF